MNLAHIHAVMKTGRRIMKATIGAGTLCSNGHILCRLDPLEGAEEYHKIAELWHKHLAEPVTAAVVGGLVRGGLNHVRHVGAAWINEAFFRCFDGDGVTWTVTAEDKPVLAHSNGILIGLVMPMRYYNDGIVVREASDAQVFAPFAREANDYYLVDDKALRREITALEIELETAEEAALYASEQVDRIERQLEQKRRIADPPVADR